MEINNNLLTAKQVSRYLSLALRTIHYLSQKGEIKSFKIGGQWKYLKEDIEKYGLEYNKNKEPNFLSPKQVSKYLGIHLRTVYRLSKKGKIKSFKIGGSWRYLREDIEKYNLNGTDFSKAPPGKSNGFIERRAYPRLNCSIPCFIRIELPRKKYISSQWTIINVSEGGVFVENNNDGEESVNAMPDDPISIEFELNRDKKIEADGRVLRKQGGCVGIKFRNIPEDIKTEISNYIG